MERLDEARLDENRSSDLVVRDRWSNRYAIDLAAYVDGELAGNITAAPATIAGQPAWTVASIYVDPNMRRRGVGQALWEAAAAEAAARGGRLASSYRESGHADAFWAKQIAASQVDVFPGQGLTGQDVYMLKPGAIVANPVPPPPVDKAAQTHWVDKTFPLGTIVVLERDRRFQTMDERTWLLEAARAPQHGLIPPPSNHVLWEAGTRAEIVYREEKTRPWITRGASVTYVVAKLLAPPIGLHDPSEPYRGARVVARRPILRVSASSTLGQPRNLIVQPGAQANVTYLDEGARDEVEDSVPFAELQLIQAGRYVVYEPPAQSWDDLVEDWRVLDPFDRWRDHLAERGLDVDSAPYVLLQSPEDFADVVPGTGRAEAIWMPTTDTWGAAPRPTPRHQLPTSQRSWLRPNARRRGEDADYTRELLARGLEPSDCGLPYASWDDATRAERARAWRRFERAPVVQPMSGPEVRYIDMRTLPSRRMFDEVWAEHFAPGTGLPLDFSGSDRYVIEALDDLEIEHPYDGPRVYDANEVFALLGALDEAVDVSDLDAAMDLAGDILRQLDVEWE